MKKYILILSFLASLMFSFGQQGDGGSPRGFEEYVNSKIEIPIYSFERPNIEKLRAEDKINDSLQTGPWRYGYGNYTSLDLLNAGVWITKENGDKVWLMEVSSEEAKTINLIFSNTKIPNGNELYVYNPEGTFVLGKFTENHIYKGELGTELVPGHRVVVEYFVPFSNANNIGNVEVTLVTHGYRSTKEYQVKAFGSSGSCNMNVNCPDGLPYENQKNSVMLISTGTGLCSGALINNTNFDGTPYVLTANHCYDNNLASWVFRFNWQSSTCGNPPSTPTYRALSGSSLRARRIKSDFLLLEITGGLTIDDKVPATHNPYFSGWDRGKYAPTSTFGIHHPSGDIKKISFDDDPAIASTFTSGSVTSDPEGTWKVSWDRNTTTEGGSSGSPLFNSNGVIIGQLWGGDAGCSNTTYGEDFYGSVYSSWNPTGSSNSGQLEHWLDPAGIGNSTIVGYDPYATPLALDVTVSNLSGHKGASCLPGFIPEILIHNSGATEITSLKVNYTYNGAATQTLNWTGSLISNGYETIPLPWMSSQNGSNEISVELSDPNGLIDDDMSDNLIEYTYNATIDGASVLFKFYMGCFPDENSWELKDNVGNILYSGGNYPSPTNSNFLDEKDFCLPNGCYTLTLKDSHGDGVYSSNQVGCNYDGRMSLTQTADNTLLASLTTAEANFGSSKSFSFCINNASVSLNEMENKVSIYPNPSKGIFNIAMDFSGTKEITLTNIAGKVVGSYKVTDNFFQINESQLSNGIYVLTISNENNRVTRKLIVE
ncbi:MAG TPA: T9SS type A sorting domain-containing protein [Brumimicrobium sp.]|nr:T9SS type A sorting domain-containing protein [Brumimicrobium sp.]